MSANWTGTLLMMGLQHLWQSALLLLLVLLLLRGSRSSAEMRSWVLLGAFVLAAASPLLVLLPGKPTVAEAPAQAAVPVERAATRSTSLATANDVQINAPTSASVSARSLLAVGMDLLALAWLLGTLWHLLRLAMAWHQAHRLHRTAVVSPALESTLRWTLPAGARIALSDAAPGPMVVGLIRPRILIPPRLVDHLSAVALRDLLLHEAAHIHRHDLWVSAAQRVVLAAYWWSPLMKQLGVRLELEREMACDERAAQQSGGGQHYAASLLTAVSDLIHGQRDRLPLAVGMSGQRGGLAQRVDSLLSMDAHPAAPGKRLAWGVLCLVGLAACAGVSVAATPRLGAAAERPTDAAHTATRPYTSSQVEQLIEAAAAGDIARARVLIDAGVPVDARQRGDGTALIAASRHGRLAMVDALLERGANVDLASTGDGNPLIAAAGNGERVVAERLLLAGADVNRIVPGDETPLINAVRSGDLGTVTLLVERGADVSLGVVADGRLWRSPLNQAGDPNVRAYLLRHGAVAERR